MKKAYFNIERQFERLVSIVTEVLGNSITFILALILVLFWWATNLFTSNDLHQDIGDIIFGTTFLSLFIIQKSFNRYSALIHLKMNELISSHEPANNSVMDMGKKTEKEIVELYKEYIETDDSADIEMDNESKENNNKN
ncbi:Low affinity Fe/Cu permease [Flavobacterium swingsii]|jgi:low affinity Fe/Cu permease|uniref:Low affinity Fe/Cu permease n=1 Tax=Flavobacterium swingsii TaxID=498292 RepID=A0A1I0WWL0_9FLAO|nr:low affinity iron permease family protein [Flavobacterium swingsii]SFA93031.1 Low affinity Fe/Cu permease [Flavobacterium swingsii]